MDMDNLVIAPNKDEQLEEMKSAEIIAKEVSPKHNVETASENIGEEVKNPKPSVKIVGDQFSHKPIVEIEAMIEEMESIDIHEEDKNVSLESETQQDDDDGDGDSESSGDSKDNDDETEKTNEEETLDEDKDKSPDSNSSTSAWTEKAAAIKNFVRVKSEVAVHTVMRRLSGKMNDENVAQNDGKDIREDDETKETKTVEPLKSSSSSVWNPLSYLKMMQNDDSVDKVEVTKIEEALEPVVMKGRIILYTRLGCQECRECRLYLHEKRLRYVEINIDVYPSRKLELDKVSGSSSSDVPKVFFNEELVGGLKELKELDESGELDEKIKHLVDETPPREAPLPPFSGEDDDASSKGPVDELALIVLKMKPCIVKDRFYKLRRFKNCFLGSEAVDFLSTDQCLAREEV